MKNKKHFSVALLKIGNKPFTLNTFSSIKEEYNKDLKEDSKIVVSRIIKKDVIEERSISLYFEEGKVLSRPEVVHNIKRHEDENNPRTIHQIERDLQIFFLIDIAF